MGYEPMALPEKFFQWYVMKEGKGYGRRAIPSFSSARTGVMMSADLSCMG